MEITSKPTGSQKFTRNAVKWVESYKACRSRANEC